MGNTLTFVASRGKALLVLLISICFVALGLWLKTQWLFVGWFTIVFFGLGIPVSLLMLLPNSMYLRLDEEGFEMGSFVRRQKYRWADVADFRIGSISGAKMIAIIFHPEYNQQRLARRAAATLSGIEAAIPNQYNATLEQLLETLTTWRQRYGRNAANQPLQPTATSVLRSLAVPRGASRGGGHRASLRGMFPAFPWRPLVIKLGALLSFCGGPLVVADSLALHLGKSTAFAVAFLPSVALVFGVYSLWSVTRDRWDNAMVAIGILGAVATLGSNIFAVRELALGSHPSDAGLVRLGITIGTAIAGYYGYASYRYFQSLHNAA